MPFVTHRPTACCRCRQALGAELPAARVERRQVRDVPSLCLEVTEHQAVALRCPACQAVTRGTFPADVRAAAQYGPRLRALAVYLHEYQLVPEERTHEVLADLFGCTVSDGTVATWTEQAATLLAPTVARIGDLVAAGPHQHTDETGVRIGGQLHWLHVNSTRWLTHLAWHPKRGRVATEAIGIWPRFRGWATHDRWASYDAYPACAHSLCGAHLLRDLTFLDEQYQQTWAVKFPRFGGSSVILVIEECLWPAVPAASNGARRQRCGRAPVAGTRQTWLGRTCCAGRAATDSPALRRGPDSTGRSPLPAPPGGLAVVW